jgi:DMSO/TMAO reductase YedYZ molybdopterin-dependent catalytic subunit
VKNLAHAEGSPEYVADVNTWKYADDPVLMAQDDTLDTYVEGDGNLDRSNGKPDGPEPGLLLTMDAIRALPKIEMVTQLKCIEGWSEIVEWGGARMSDFMHAYPPARGANGRLPRYVGFETPDRQYYVGLYMEDALHPQTLLCYEINGQPLSREHGAPLRLVTPLKYGIKHLKQIGSISYTEKRPRDYWAENDYDYYAGH